MKRNVISASQISDATQQEKVMNGNVKTIVIKNLNSPNAMYVGFNEDASSKIQINAGDGLVLSLDDGTCFDGNRLFFSFAALNAQNYGYLIVVRELPEEHCEPGRL